MTRWKILLGIALLSVITTVVTLRVFDSRRSREASQLRARNARLQTVLAAAQKGYARSFAQKAELPSAVGRSVPEPIVAPNYWNEGRATPLAALQTFAWACDRGDIDAVRQLVVIDPDGRPKAEAFYASLPANARAQWKSVDEMAATLLTQNGMEHPFPSADMLSTTSMETMRDGRVRWRMPGLHRDGMEFQQDSGGWKRAITAEMVDNYLRQAAKTSAGR
ncbi:MAG: hypothetical protein ABI273_20960 [Lacunisphaera sp.]